RNRHAQPREGLGPNARARCKVSPATRAGYSTTQEPEPLMWWSVWVSYGPGRPSTVHWSNFTHGKARHTKSGEGRFSIPPQSTEATLASGSGRRLLPPGVATWKVFPRKRTCRSALIETLPTPTTDNNPQSRRIT